VAHFLRLIEEEIIRNRDHLLGDNFLPRRYRTTEQDEIDAENPGSRWSCDEPFGHLKDWPTLDS